MRSYNSLKYFILIFLLFFSCSLFASTNAFIAAEAAPAFSSPDNKGTPQVKIPMGTQVKKVKTQDFWVQISHKSQSLWIHNMYLSDKNPKAARRGFLSVFKGMISKMKKKAGTGRKRATVMGIRGLDEEGDLKNLDIEPDYDTVDRIDRQYFPIKPRVMKKFLRTMH